MRKLISGTTTLVLLLTLLAVSPEGARAEFFCCPKDYYQISCNDKNAFGRTPVNDTCMPNSAGTIFAWNLDSACQKYGKPIVNCTDTQSCYPDGTCGQKKIDPSCSPYAFDSYHGCCANITCEPTNSLSGNCINVYSDCIPGVEPKCTDVLYSKFSETLKGCVSPRGETTKWELIYADCPTGGKGINTAVGCVPTGNLTSTISFVLKWTLGIAGGVILLMLIATGYTMLTSAGNPEKLQAVKENMVSIFSGLILIFFSLVLLEAIGADILGLPNFIK